MNQKRLKYLSPSLEVVALENEATVMTGSVGDMNNTPWSSKSSSKASYSTVSSGELEDMVNDILTIEN